ncbi:tryptophan-rich sensory protein [Sphingosinicellaceae bacterium]|nr:tryptophan-rich sensory protein [Sphingosinicellaceae bacterium]
MQTVIYVAAGCALALGTAGGATTPLTPWYRDLAKPPWQPPNWLFGPAWSLILAGAATAAVWAWNAADAAGRVDLIIAYAVNAVFFLLWSPLFFVARRPDWAMIEWVFLWVSVAVLVVVVHAQSPAGAWFVVPYLLWVSFAGVLNRAIVIRNAPFGRETRNTTGTV